MGTVLEIFKPFSAKWDRIGELTSGTHFFKNITPNGEEDIVVEVSEDGSESTIAQLTPILDNDNFSEINRALGGVLFDAKIDTLKKGESTSPIEAIQPKGGKSKFVRFTQE